VTANRATYSNGQRGPNLIEESKNWMTPNTMDALAPKSQQALDHEHQTARPGRATPNNLRDQASVQAGMTFWPTPATRDHKRFDSPGKKNIHQDPAMYLSSHLGQTMQRDGHTCSTSCRRLSPRFAENLMGLPHGWVNSSEPLEMASFQAWRQELSRRSLYS